MDWLELSVEVDHEAVEPVSELFARLGYNGGVVVEQSVEGPQAEQDSWDELQHPEIDPTRPISVRTYLPLDAEAGDKKQHIEEALWHLGRMRPVGELHTRQCKEEDWANAWKAFYGVQRIGKHIVIKPSWLEYTPKEGDVVLDLDPGMAFGTGLHPTTRLCLAALEDYVPRLTAEDNYELRITNYEALSAHRTKSKIRVPPGRPKSKIILDLGTGSGILAITAAKLGGEGVRVVALDTDPVAVDATTQNVERNGLTAQIEVGHGSAEAAKEAEPYDLVVANILASVIIELSKSLSGLLAPGGTLISSGIFFERGEAVKAALERAGMPVREERKEGDWLCLVSVREQ
ncbi:MAG: 50S ribosomal protein L11 methyltransferase [Chloroflexia bacterium]